MSMTWQDFSSSATQLAVLVAMTGLVYRLLRMWYPDVPEAVMQFVAAIMSSVTSLAVTYSPVTPKYQWLMVGISSGVLTSAQVIKLLDWSASAMTRTGAPAAGLPEKAPAWYVALHPDLRPARAFDPVSEVSKDPAADIAAELTKKSGA